MTTLHTSIISSFLDAHLRLVDNATKKQKNVKTFHPSVNKKLPPRHHTYKQQKKNLKFKNVAIHFQKPNLTHIIFILFHQHSFHFHEVFHGHCTCPSIIWPIFIDAHKHLQKFYAQSRLSHACAYIDNVEYPFNLKL